MPASDCLFLFAIPVCIIEDLPDGLALGGLCEANHVVRGADLHEGEARLQTEQISMHRMEIGDKYHHQEIIDQIGERRR